MGVVILAAAPSVTLPVTSTWPLPERVPFIKPPAKVAEPATLRTEPFRSSPLSNV